MEASGGSQSDAFRPFVPPPLVTPGNPWLSLRGVTGKMWGSEHRHWRLPTLVPIVQPSQTTLFYFCLTLSFYLSLHSELICLFLALFLSSTNQFFINYFIC